MNLIEEYLAAEQPGKQAARFIKPFTDFCEGLEIDAKTLLDYRTFSCSKWREPSARNRYIGGLRSFVHWLRLTGRAKLTKDEISDTLRSFKQSQKRIEILTPEQVRQVLLKACDMQVPRAADYRRFILLALVTGARPGEIGNIKGEHFDLGEKVLHIFAEKTQRARRVPFKWSSTLQRIAEPLSKCREVMHLTGARNGPMSRTWRAIEAACGLEFEPRIMRRTCRSFVASSGHVPDAWLSEWFGHTDATARKHYQLAQEPREGDTLEAWMQASLEFSALSAKVLLEL